MVQTKELLNALSSLMTVSGSEHRSADELYKICGSYFDEFEQMPNGNCIFIKKCGRDNAHRLLIDAHFDEIGMMVSSISDDGFCKLVPIGGLDTRIMLAGEVIIYGDEEVYGVVPVKAPHLQKPGENKKLPPANELTVDTGYTKEQLTNKGVRVGTPVGFKNVNCELLNGRLAGKGFDDKCCVAAAVMAISELRDFDCDVYLLCACKEETGMLGARTGGYKINPDAAIVLDVNFASVPDTKRHTTIKMDEGPSITLSVVTDRSLTASIINCAERNDLKLQKVVEATNTGTDATALYVVREGIPVAVVSIPLKNMHTYSEVISVKDVEDTANLLKTYIEDKEGFIKWINA